MNVAVFGGSGFLGYDFVRFAARAGGVKLTVYSGSAENLANVARHDVGLRLYSVNAAETMTIQDGTDVVIDFAHPFDRRGGISGADQIRQFVRVVDDARRANPDLKLVYLSSMSVFEPFASNRRFGESDALRPPREDRYANEKILAETLLRTLADADRWQLHLRPTVVYGPFCRPFTDRLLDVFRRGDVGYRDLSGRIQPVYGADISRFIYERLFDFRAGVYNFAGPEEMSWHAFVDTFREIVGIGRLVQVPEADAGADSRTFSLKDDARRLLRVVRQEPAFDRLAGRIVRRVPRSVGGKLSRLLKGTAPAPVQSTAITSSVNTELLGRSFFATDRLVSTGKLSQDFPTLQPARLSDARAVLESYYRFRFSDCRVV